MIDDLINMIDACKANLANYQAMGDDLAVDACQGMIDHLMDDLHSAGGYYPGYYDKDMDTRLS